MCECEPPLALPCAALLRSALTCSLCLDWRWQVSVDLPKKHGRGGQSALRFARLRMEKRHNYVRKVAELAVQVTVCTGMLAGILGGTVV
jgi:peptide subunit release factor 1 (eRF1)